MSTLNHTFDIETYVLMEKAANQAGKNSVEEWLDFLLTERVGHTSFYTEG